MSNTDSFTQDDGGVGLAKANISQRRRQLLDLINKLHSTGAQVDIDLPQIAVIGSQSAGKSSLIESISGITLPRAAGTCTRCPTECRLANSDNGWKCVVSLRFIKDADGQPLGTARNEQFGDVIVDKHHVEERLRRAQRAILNPSRRLSEFLDGEDEDLVENQLSFSANCVSLQISGPGVADLSFCDLPGLIASTGSSGNEGDISLVKSLVEAYISKPSCLILLTVACETDFENQGAHNLAKKYDTDGKRTIGVLTKPDRIPAGEEDGWVHFIRGEREALENNWYCVKQPSSTDIKKGITWTEARQHENDFFATVSPWAGLDPIYQKYLRTSNLVERLSHILSDLISKRLPDIRLEMERAIEKTLGLLASMPSPPSNNPLQEVSALLSEFARDVSRHVDGVPDPNGVIQSVRRAQEDFQRKILSTSPGFRPYEKCQAATICWSQPPFLSKDERDIDFGKTLGVDIIYVDEVFSRALSARTRELPGNYPFMVTAAYVAAFTDRWQVPARLLCKEVFMVMGKSIDQLVTKHFGTFGQKLLEQRVRLHVQEHLKHRLEAAEAQVNWLIKLEGQPFTLNTHYLADYRQKFFNHYKSIRQQAEHSTVASTLARYVPPEPITQRVSPSSRTPNETVNDVLSGLANIGFTGTKASDLGALLPADQMEVALKIMADVRAYFQVAYKRFSDNVPLAIDYDLVYGLDRDLLVTLCERLGIHSPNGQDICREFSQESPQVADRRQELTRKLERLQSAYQELMQSS